MLNISKSDSWKSWEEKQEVLISALVSEPLIVVIRISQDHLDKLETHYGEIANDAWLMEIEKNKKQFEMVDLVSPSWTIKVPRRK